MARHAGRGDIAGAVRQARHRRLARTFRPDNADAIFWSLAYRSNFVEDVHITPYRSSGHGPKSGRAATEGTIMIDATLKHDMPPLALPTEEFMMRAKEIWQELDLPRITPQAPWHGYEMGDWDDAWTEFAEAAVAGDWRKSGDVDLRTQARKPDPRNAGALCGIAQEKIEKK